MFVVGFIFFVITGTKAAKSNDITVRDIISSTRENPRVRASGEG